MLLDGINDDEHSILEFKKLLKELKYDRLYLNTPVRPPAEADVNVVSEERMRYAVETLGGISIEMMSSGAFFSEIEDDYEAVKSIIGRHPMNQFEVRGFLESRDVKDQEAMMEKMKQDVIDKYHIASEIFPDAEEEDRQFLQTFSFICLLSFDV